MSFYLYHNAFYIICNTVFAATIYKITLTHKIMLCYDHVMLISVLCKL